MKLFQYEKTGTTAVVLAVLYLILFGAWIANLVKFIGILDNPVGAMFVARLVGLFVAPLGALLGFV